MSKINKPFAKLAQKKERLKTQTNKTRKEKENITRDAMEIKITQGHEQLRLQISRNRCNFEHTQTSKIESRGQRKHEQIYNT